MHMVCVVHLRMPFTFQPPDVQTELLVPGSTPLLVRTARQVLPDVDNTDKSITDTPRWSVRCLTVVRTGLACLIRLVWVPAFAYVNLRPGANRRNIPRGCNPLVYLGLRPSLWVR